MRPPTARRHKMLHTGPSGKRMIFFIFIQIIYSVDNCFVRKRIAATLEETTGLSAMFTICENFMKQ